jgi:oligopeptide transport system permease protein
MLRLRESKTRKLEAALAAARDAQAGPPSPEDVDDALFVPAAYDASGAERLGYSNYSYWGSTLRVFFKKPVAVFLLIVLAVLLVFTFNQPLLPGQYPATLIINHPITKQHLSNVQPLLTTVKTVAPAGTRFIVHPYANEEWAAVTNVAGTVQRRQTMTVDQYLGDWVHVTHKDLEGYVANDFANKLKLPADPTATPYETQSNFPVKIFLLPEDYTNAGAELFARREALAFAEDGQTATSVEDLPLRILPSENAFWFGTNNIGQDLWSLVWSGTRTSLFIGFMVALVEALIGILVGVLWGYVRRLDRIMTEIYNVVDNIPTTIVLILVAYVLRPGIATLVFAMCLTGWVGMARFIRNQIVIIRDRDYNLASRCLGVGTPRIVMRNLLPYLVSVITLRIALAIPEAIGNEVFITYIGLGLPVSVPSLGNLINAGRKLISTSQSYQLIFPTVVLSIVTISFYIIGNSFADAADPKNHV